MAALRAHTTIGSRARRLSPVRKPDRIALRWQRQHAAAAEFWRTVGPTINAAITFDFDRRQLPDVLERALDGDRDTPLVDRVAAELAGAIEANR